MYSVWYISTPRLSLSVDSLLHATSFCLASNCGARYELKSQLSKFVSWFLRLCRETPLNGGLSRNSRKIRQLMKLLWRSLCAVSVSSFCMIVTLFLFRLQRWLCDLKSLIFLLHSASQSVMADSESIIWNFHASTALVDFYYPKLHGQEVLTTKTDTYLQCFCKSSDAYFVCHGLMLISNQVGHSAKGCGASKC